MRIAIINGPNLNLLGKREPGIYGGRTFEDYLETLRSFFPETELLYFQSNVEGELINYIHEFGFDADGIIINAGGYTHTSVALGDALRAVKTAAVEVHISNIFEREDYRHVSMIGNAVRGVISGFGLDSYRLAVEALLELRKP